MGGLRLQLGYELLLRLVATTNLLMLPKVVAGRYLMTALHWQVLLFVLSLVRGVLFAYLRELKLIGGPYSH